MAAAAVQAERDEVERPIVEQLVAMGWTHVPGREVGTLDAIEAKGSDLADPIRSAVLDLHYYAGAPVVDDERKGTDLPLPAGVPELFRTVQLLVAATGETAYLGTVTSSPDHFHPWRSV